jgi:hypothetical protein
MSELFKGKDNPLTATARVTRSLSNAAQVMTYFVSEELSERHGSGYSKGSSWRRELVKIKGKSKSLYRDLKTGRFIKKP